MDFQIELRNTCSCENASVEMIFILFNEQLDEEISRLTIGVNAAQEGHAPGLIQRGFNLNEAP